MSASLFETDTPFSPPKPAHRAHLPRSPSDPILHPSHSPQQPQQVYVLSADGSSLWLVDPSKPPGNEEPPPYETFTTIPNAASGHDEPESGPSSPVRVGVPFPRSSSAMNRHVGVPQSSRHRASTMSALGADRSIGSRIGLATGLEGSRLGLHPAYSHRSSSSLGGDNQLRTRSSLSSPRVPGARWADETTALLSTRPREDLDAQTPPRRSLLRSIFCGELEADDEDWSWKAGWRRFWTPTRQEDYWRAMWHLWFINFPFALLVWPPLLVGTLVGTALLITLPIGAVVWWLTLFIARSAARFEVYYHSPLRPSLPPANYHPIFHRMKDRSVPNSPVSRASEMPVDIVWEKRFMKCSYAMFCDHYSYSALSYFLLIKPLIVLFSTIVIIALLPVSAVLVLPLPVYMRAARRWGRWQAGVALENL